MISFFLSLFVAYEVFLFCQCSSSWRRASSAAATRTKSKKGSKTSRSKTLTLTRFFFFIFFRSLNLVSLSKVLLDTRDLKKEIAQKTDVLKRSFAIVDELIFKDAKEDACEGAVSVVLLLSFSFSL